MPVFVPDHVPETLQERWEFVIVSLSLIALALLMPTWLALKSGLARQQVEAALHKSETRFRDFAETASDWFWETDMEQRYTYYSGAGPGIDLKGWDGPPGTSEMVIGRTRREHWGELQGRDLDVTDTIADYMARGAAFSNLEVSHRHPERGRVHVSLFGKPVTDDGGNIAAYRGTGRDITESKQAEEEIHRLNEDLEQRIEERTTELRAAQAELLRQERLATLGKLTATVSHELRNPLGVIRTSAFVVRDGLKEEAPRARRALERIERGVIRCDRIIDEMLDFTRISEIEAESTPIDACLEEILNEQTVPSGVSLRRDFGLGGMTVFLDCDRFRRAIINVFDNACQAMLGEGIEDADSEEHTLTVQTQKHHGRIEVIFEDTGPGIPPDVYGMIFEPLYSTKSFGVGLGLPVVKQIMEQHGGGIEIESEEGRGTRVCLWLPHGHSTH